MYTLAKQARNLEAFKLARHVLDRLQSVRIPERFQVEIVWACAVLSPIPVL